MLLLTLGPAAMAPSQEKGFIVKRCLFSSALDNEFSPVYYGDGLVFCSNQRDNSLAIYKNGDERLYNIVTVSAKGKSGWKQPILFSRDLQTHLNEGPASFNASSTRIYFSRNNPLALNRKNKSAEADKLGIFSAENKGGSWGNVKALAFVDPRYNYTTPSISPDGSRLYFASDIPGGAGGMDLYYSAATDEGWGDPVNLGPVINTPMNESFPFAGRYGVLYFASDGHKGEGGKDIYYTRQADGKWIEPVHLDSAINSPFDDFGLVADSTFEHGYFSSNRMNTDDIFSFSAAPPVFPDCDSIAENKYCFTFFDERHNLMDTVPAIYRWDFGEGMVVEGVEVKHCFQGPGDYNVRLTIIDGRTGDTISSEASYEVGLEDIRQAVIGSYDIGVTDNPVTFKAGTESLKGEEIIDIFWDFGDGYAPGGPVANHTFRKAGEYIVKLGLGTRADSSGGMSRRCVMKRIKVFSSCDRLNVPDRKAASGNQRGSAGNGGLFTVAAIVMDDIPQNQKAAIRSELAPYSDMSLALGRAGLEPSANPLLAELVKLLGDLPGIRAEMIIHPAGSSDPAGKMSPAEILSHELEFYFKNSREAAGRFRSYAADRDAALLRTGDQLTRAGDNLIELVFTKNQ